MVDPVSLRNLIANSTLAEQLVAAQESAKEMERKALERKRLREIEDDRERVQESTETLATKNPPQNEPNTDEGLDIEA